MTQIKAKIEKWEKIEVERSANEAKQIESEKLLMDKTQVARYLDPPANTVFPLEYSYYLLGDANGKTVLDFGCGAGKNTALLSMRGAKVIGLDISEDLIELAKERLVINEIKNEASFIVCSAHEIDLPDESVDMVFGMAILHHLELPLVAKEVHRVLKKGGRAIFQEPVRNSKLVKFVRNMIPYKDPNVSPFERPLTDKELKEFASEFSSYKSRAFCLPFVNLAQIVPRLRPFVMRLSRVDGAILKTIKPLNYYATIRVIEMVK